MADKSGSTVAYASIIIAVIPILVGLYEYKVNNEREFGKNFLTQQSQVYEELLNDLGGISTSISNPTDSLSQSNYNTAKFNFNQLYYGKLNLYQSPSIEKITDSLFTMINTYDSSRQLSNQQAGLAELIDNFQNKVYKLSDECKRSLKNTYDLK